MRRNPRGSDNPPMSSRTVLGWGRRVAMASVLAASGLGASGVGGASAPLAAVVSPASGHAVSAAAGGGFYGSTGAIRLAQPIVGMAATPSGRGYWLVASDGGIFSFGDAGFHGSTGAIRLAQPIVGMAATPSGSGYWLVASDGGIFSFGDAAFFGSAAGSMPAGVAGMAATSTGHGYWIAGADGTVRPYGDALGSAGTGSARVVGLAGVGRAGFWAAGADGSVVSGGAAASYGSVAGAPLAQPIVGLAADRAGDAYWLVAADGGIFAASRASTLSAPTTTSSTYTFLAQNGDGTPIRFNPCASVHYVVNLAGAPATAAGDVSGALSRIAQATGLSFVSDGTTNELPESTRPAYQPGRYGPRWAPILIAWSTAAQSDFLGGTSTVGQGGSTWYQAPGSHAVYVTGQVAVNGPATASLAPGFGSGLTMGALLLHELGHVVGLGHVSDPTQIMYPDLHTRGSTQYGPGDLGGLERLGASQGCLTVPAAA
jgi:hypothetical protein